VVEAANGREALARFEEQSVPLDLLLSDVVMPGISGIKLAELLRAKAPALRVLYMSGYVDEAFQQGGAMSEAQLLQKPFNRDELIRRVQAVLESGEGRPSG
jgi:YesN/AraC family two-component response regulator